MLFLVSLWGWFPECLFLILGNATLFLLYAVDPSFSPLALKSTWQMSLHRMICWKKILSTGTKVWNLRGSSFNVIFPRLRSAEYLWLKSSTMPFLLVGARSTRRAWASPPDMVLSFGFFEMHHVSSHSCRNHWGVKRKSRDYQWFRVAKKFSGFQIIHKLSHMFDHSISWYSVLLMQCSSMTTVWSHGFHTVWKSQDWSAVSVSPGAATASQHGVDVAGGVFSMSGFG